MATLSKAYAAAWREKNREHTQAYMKAWREARREELRGYYSAWREKNREKIRVSARDNQWKHRGIRRAQQAKRMGTLVAVGPAYTAKDWQKYLDLFGDRCLACGQLPEKLTADHIIPVSLGGTNTIDNIQGLCRSCNASKFTRIVDYRIAREAG